MAPIKWGQAGAKFRAFGLDLDRHVQQLLGEGAPVEIEGEIVAAPGPGDVLETIMERGQPREFHPAHHTRAQKGKPRADFRRRRPGAHAAPIAGIAQRQSDDQRTAGHPRAGMGQQAKLDERAHASPSSKPTRGRT
jgi:hypothetical protein